jgi:predicted P-loop ATPase
MRTTPLSNQKISYLDNITSKTVREIDLDNAYQIISKGHPFFVSTSKEATIQKVKALKQEQKLPVFIFSALCQGGHSKTKITSYTNLYCGDIDNLDSYQEAEKVRLMLSKNPSILLCFVSPSQKGVKFVLRLKEMARPKNLLQNQADSSRFTLLDNYHKAWHTIIEKDFKKLYNINLDSQCSNVNRLCYLSYDPNAYYNPNALEYEFEEPYKDILPLYLNLNAKHPNQEGHRNTLLYSLNLKAQENGIDPKAIEEFAQNYFTLGSKEIENALKATPTETKTKKSTKTKRENIVSNHEIMQEFEKEYQIRHNVVLDGFEVKAKGKRKWKLLDDIQENSIFKHITNAYPTLSKTRIVQLIKTDEAPKYDIFVSYFEKLPPWDKHDYIKELTQSITTPYPELLESDFKKWLVGLVATAINPDVVNNFCFVLAGTEGTGKSTFMNKIIPAELRENHYQDNRLDIKNKDLNFKLSQNLLINLEEFDKYTKRELPEIKAIITNNNIQERPHYGKTQKKYIRRCSFCATINKTDFLSGQEGERRFLIHQVLSMQYDYQINHTQLYAQAYTLLQEGFKYWESGEEILTRKQINRTYRETTMAEELFNKYYRKPTPEETQQNNPSVKFLTATDIKVHLSQHYGVATTDISVIKVGFILTEGEFEKKTIKGQKRYTIFEKSKYEIEEEQSFFI